MRSLRTTLLGLALALTLTAPLALAGCGASDEQTPKTYTDPDLGLSFQYPGTWQVVSSGKAEITGGADPVATITAGDPKGARAGDTGLDLVMVRVYRLNTTIDESLLPALLMELEPLVADMQSQDPTMVIEQPLTQTSVNGIPGFQFTWTFDWDDKTPAKSTSYFLFAGDIEYQLVVQSSAATWVENQDVFAVFLSTFQPGGSPE